MPVKFRTEQQERDFAIDDKYRYLIDEKAWYIDNRGYIRRAICESDTKVDVHIHRHILVLDGCSLKGLCVDHINGNKLDNRAKNLRVATHSQNGCNRGKQKNNTSGFKGVSWDDSNKAWRAQISVTKKQIYLGCYQCPKEAHDVYLAAAQKYHGEFSFENRSLSG